MAQLRNYFLGPFQVTYDDRSVIGFESDKGRALLAYVQSGNGKVARVFTAANGETDALAAALDERLREPCVRLEADAPALAAALDA